MNSNVCVCVWETLKDSLGGEERLEKSRKTERV